MWINWLSGNLIPECDTAEPYQKIYKYGLKQSPIHAINFFPIIKITVTLEYPAIIQIDKKNMQIEIVSCFSKHRTILYKLNNMIEFQSK